MKFLNYNIFLILIIICFFAFSNEKTSYHRYQTFDEYKLKGYNESGNIQSPYVLVSISDDTISVIIPDKKTIVYANKVDYWYSIKKDKGIYDPNCLCDTGTVRITEKFIFNDTIISVHFDENKEKRYLLGMLVDTRKTQAFVLLADSNKLAQLNDFQKFRHLAGNYSQIYPYRDIKKRQPQYYEYYDKVFKPDTLYFFENRGRQSCDKPYKTRLLNSLGEFGTQ